MKSNRRPKYTKSSIKKNWARFCPICDARRIAESAALLGFVRTEHVGHAQWALNIIGRKNKQAKLFGGFCAP
jgi:hypothetical protein